LRLLDRPCMRSKGLTIIVVVLLSLILRSAHYLPGFNEGARSIQSDRVATSDSIDWTYFDRLGLCTCSGFVLHAK